MQILRTAYAASGNTRQTTKSSQPSTEGNTPACCSIFFN